jgi:predicted ATPase/class 3 adenylate cyclase
MTDPPSGLVTLLFTDIEGSTRLLRRLGEDEYRDVLAVHNRLIRGAIAPWQGEVEGTEGDSFFVIFRSPTNAVAAAAAAQEALAGEDWRRAGDVRVRMGVHTGEVRVEHELLTGNAIHFAHRVMEAAHGGQVLLSEATKVLLDERVAVLDLGEHRLKSYEDLSPTHLYQLLIRGAPRDFPPPRTAGGRPNNLPLPLELLVGRDDEIAEIASLLAQADTRVLTLIGPGGSGKTELALAAAADYMDAADSGAFVAELAPIRSHWLVVPTIAQSLGLREQADEPLLDTVIRYLQDRKLLLLLDNFEHVLEATPDVTRLLQAKPDLKLLATSRAPLRIRGEKLFPVKPLGLPALEGADFETIADSAAVKLFVNRATATQPDFELNARNAPAVAEICRRLDGLPLAIVLAAARVRALSPSAILSRLDQRLKLLTTGPRDSAARHRSLEATLAWSFDLLSSAEQMLFARLAVFAGGCRAGAAGTVCKAGADLKIDVFDGLLSLVDQSVIEQREDPDGEPRFSMLETIREFALVQLERLSGRPTTGSDERNRIEQAHAHYFAAFAERASAAFRGADEERWLDLLEKDHANLRAALDWFERSDEIAAETRLAADLSRFWYVRGHLTEGRLRLERLLEKAPTTGSDRDIAAAIDGAALLAREQGDYDEARDLFNQAIRIYSANHDQLGEARSLYHLGILEGRAGRHPAARSAYQASLCAAHSAGDRWTKASSWRGLAHEAVHDGDWSRAERALNVSAAYFVRARDPRGYAISLRFAAELAFAEGRNDVARAQLRDALQILRRLDDRWSINNALLALAGVAAAERQWERALVLEIAAENLRAAIGARLPVDDAAKAERWLAVAHAHCPDDQLTPLRRKAATLTLDAAVAYALEERTLDL